MTSQDGGYVGRGGEGNKTGGRMEGEFQGWLAQFFP